ncbi:uracil-DNA glycosylase [uncultured Phascolarctobacterium sp.]|uniref:uracil-DNA glycosylase n=1 Tax=uncultured Phascolarctobacterium sp. TaxID=512296 RepID=UPI0025F69523|nr:uracil-DNA glycosylase [uncultured Phascolarctobacterium sp.]
MDLQALEQELKVCQSCPLRGDAIAPVGWYGDPHSPIVFVGEGPGGVEDDYGCPLIGPSGQLLDKALWAVKMTRDRVLTTNVIKCRPKNNRTPDIAEADFCAKMWLERELEIIQPKVVVALGSVALHFLGNPNMRITRDRGQWFRTRQGFDCIATYHPAYLLRLTGKQLVAAKWDVFHDLEAARARTLQLAPDSQLMSEEKTDLFKLFKKRVNDYL